MSAGHKQDRPAVAPGHPIPSLIQEKTQHPKGGPFNRNTFSMMLNDKKVI